MEESDDSDRNGKGNNPKDERKERKVQPPLFKPLPHDLTRSYGDTTSSSSDEEQELPKKRSKLRYSTGSSIDNEHEVTPTNSQLPSSATSAGSVDLDDTQPYDEGLTSTPGIKILDERKEDFYDLSPPTYVNDSSSFYNIFDKGPPPAPPMSDFWESPNPDRGTLVEVVFPVEVELVTSKGFAKILPTMILKQSTLLNPSFLELLWVCRAYNKTSRIKKNTWWQWYSNDITSETIIYAIIQFSRKQLSYYEAYDLLQRTPSDSTLKLAYTDQPNMFGNRLAIIKEMSSHQANLGNVKSFTHF